MKPTAMLANCETWTDSGAVSRFPVHGRENPGMQLKLLQHQLGTQDSFQGINKGVDALAPHSTTLLAYASARQGRSGTASQPAKRVPSHDQKHGTRSPHVEAQLLLWELRLALLHSQDSREVSDASMVRSIGLCLNGPLETRKASPSWKETKIINKVKR